MDDLDMLTVVLNHTVSLKGLSGVEPQLFRFAVSRGSLPIIKKMLECGADPLGRSHLDAKGHDGIDAIKIAIIRGDLDVIKLLWETSPKINEVKRFKKYLNCSAEFPSENSVKVAEYILSQGVLENEVRLAILTAKEKNAIDLADLIKGYHLAQTEKKLLNKSVQESAPKAQKASSKTKRAATRI